MKNAKNLIYAALLLIAISLLNIGHGKASQANISLSITIDPQYLIVSAGDSVIIQVNLVQLGDQNRKDVIASLSLVEASGKANYISTETIALETKASFIAKIDIPKDANAGDYNIDVELFDLNGKSLLAKASRQIVVEKTKITRAQIYLIGFFLSVINLFLLIIVVYKHNKKYHSKTKITKFDIRDHLEQREIEA